MAVLVKYPCSGTLHDLVFTGEGDVIPLDHDIEAEIAAHSMGADPPPCMKLMMSWEHDTDLSAKEFIINSGILPPIEFVDYIIALAWHVAPIFEERLPGNGMVRRLLELAEKVAKGMATPGEQDEADEIRSVIESPRYQGAVRSASLAAAKAYKAAWWLDYDREHPGKWPPTNISSEISDAAWTVIQYGRLAVKRQKSHELKMAEVPLEERWNLADAAKEAERRWQLAKFNEALERVYGTIE